MTLKGISEGDPKSIAIMPPATALTMIKSGHLQRMNFRESLTDPVATRFDRCLLILRVLPGIAMRGATTVNQFSVEHYISRFNALAVARDELGRSNV